MNAVPFRGLFSLSAAALLGLLIAAQESAATTLNLLLLGDSITAKGQYIAPLETLLTQGGYSYSAVTNEGQGGYFIAQNYTINGVQYTLPTAGKASWRAFPPRARAT
jgi:hypothetical protein